MKRRLNSPLAKTELFSSLHLFHGFFNLPRQFERDQDLQHRLTRRLWGAHSRKPDKEVLTVEVTWLNLYRGWEIFPRWPNISNLYWINSHFKHDHFWSNFEKLLWEYFYQLKTWKIISKKFRLPYKSVLFNIRPLALPTTFSLAILLATLVTERARKLRNRFILNFIQNLHLVDDRSTALQDDSCPTVNFRLNRSKNENGTFLQM